MNKLSRKKVEVMAYLADVRGLFRILGKDDGSFEVRMLTYFDRCAEGIAFLSDGTRGVIAGWLWAEVKQHLLLVEQYLKAPLRSQTFRAEVKRMVDQRVGLSRKGKCTPKRISTKRSTPMLKNQL